MIDCQKLFFPTNQTKSKLSTNEVVRKDLRKIGAYWKGCILIDWDGGRTDPTAFAIDDLVLQGIVNSSSIGKTILSEEDVEPKNCQTRKIFSQ